jgi:hypothetical protein
LYILTFMFLDKLALYSIEYFVAYLLNHISFSYLYNKANLN